MSLTVIVRLSPSLPPLASFLSVPLVLVISARHLRMGCTAACRENRESSFTRSKVSIVSPFTNTTTTHNMPHKLITRSSPSRRPASALLPPTTRPRAPMTPRPRTVATAAATSHSSRLVVLSSSRSRSSVRTGSRITRGMAKRAIVSSSQKGTATRAGERLAFLPSGLVGHPSSTAPPGG